MHRAERLAASVRLWGIVLLLAGCGGGSGSGGPGPGASVPPDAPRCALGGDPIELTGEVATTDEKTYALFPFAVEPGTGRVEVAYRWSDKGILPPTPLTQTVLDLGLWDADGARNADGFRGWSGSRQGRLDQGQPPVFVEADAAERGYMPGPIEPGVWHVELGYAAVAPGGADWTVRIACEPAPEAEPPAPDSVDPTHVARPGPGWFHGDMHMHGYHSNPDAPRWSGFIQQARAAGLDFLMVTEYVTGAHWSALGPVQRANPDLLIWPGREIITYFGHVNILGETPDVLEYRHGFEDVSLGDIQARAKAAGALFQVNHPTFFPGPLFENFCRGCEFELDEAIDWSRVDTIEVLTGPVRVQAEDVGVPLPLPVQIQSPFMTSAIRLWEDLLERGYEISAVSGSDSKGVDAPAARDRLGYGSSATAVYADELSRPAMKAALKAGRAYVRTLGVDDSPALRFTVTTDDGQQGMFGDAVFADAAVLETVVTGGEGQVLRYHRDGRQIARVRINDDPFVHRMSVERRDDSGPLGTWFRIDTRDAKSLTAIGNPVFLRAPGTGEPG